MTKKPLAKLLLFSFLMLPVAALADACPDPALILRAPLNAQKMFAEEYIDNQCADPLKDGLFDIGDRFYMNLALEKNFPKAEIWLLDAAEHGHGTAQIRLGFMYGEKHFPGIATDLAKAEYWFIQAATQAAEHGKFRLGNFYHHYKQPPDYVKAGYWLKRAADEDHEGTAQYDLARLYRSGKLGAPDYAEALKYMTLAAENDIRQAQMALALWYEKGGQGVTPDLNKALFWTQKIIADPGRSHYWQNKADELKSRSK